MYNLSSCLFIFALPHLPAPNSSLFRLRTLWRILKRHKTTSRSCFAQAMIVSTYFNTLRFILFRVLLHRHCPEGRTPSHGHHRRLCGAVYAAAECYTPEGHGDISLSYHPGTVVCSDTAVRHIVKYLLWPRLQEPTRCRSSGPGHLVAGLKLHSSSEQDNGQEENKNPGKRVQNNKLTARAVLLKRSSAGEGIKFWVIFSSHRAVPQQKWVAIGVEACCPVAPG